MRYVLTTPCPYAIEEANANHTPTLRFAAAYSRGLGTTPYAWREANTPMTIAELYIDLEATKAKCG